MSHRHVLIHKSSRVGLMQAVNTLVSSARPAFHVSRVFARTTRATRTRVFVADAKGGEAFWDRMVAKASGKSMSSNTETAVFALG